MVLRQLIMMTCRMTEVNTMKLEQYTICLVSLLIVYYECYQVSYNASGFRTSLIILLHDTLNAEVTSG